jgi:hypothetical protein
LKETALMDFGAVFALDAAPAVENSAVPEGQPALLNAVHPEARLSLPT